MSELEEPGDAAHLIGLARVFTPAQAAAVLRSIGLDDITECALKTRVYRKQIPFHLNGRRIYFTLDDLREIAEGHACRPDDSAETLDPLIPVTRTPARSRRQRTAEPAATADPSLWRARQVRNG
jgi:hypothetical protein